MANNAQQVMDALTLEFKGAVSGMTPVLANEAVNFTLERFTTGKDINDKPFVKRAVNNKKNAGRAILVQSGRLFRSIRIIQQGEKDFSYGTQGVPYAQIHNDGGTITQFPRSELIVRNRYKRGPKKGSFKKGTTAGKGFTFGIRTIRMPQRKYLGKSKLLTDRLIATGQKFLEKKLAP